MIVSYSHSFGYFMWHVRGCPGLVRRQYAVRRFSVAFNRVDQCVVIIIFILNILNGSSGGVWSGDGPIFLWKCLVDRCHKPVYILNNCTLCLLLGTWSRYRVLKWACFVSRVIILIFFRGEVCWGSISGLMLIGWRAANMLSMSSGEERNMGEMCFAFRLNGLFECLYHVQTFKPATATLKFILITEKCGAKNACVNTKTGGDRTRSNWHGLNVNGSILFLDRFKSKSLPIDLGVNTFLDRYSGHTLSDGPAISKVRENVRSLEKKNRIEKQKKWKKKCFLLSKFDSYAYVQQQYACKAASSIHKVFSMANPQFSLVN